VTFDSAAIGIRQVRVARILSILGFIGLYTAIGTAIAALAWLKHPSFLLSTYLFWLVPWFISYVVGFIEPKAAGRVAIEGATVRIERGSTSRVLQRSEIVSAQSVVRGQSSRAEITLTNGNVISVAMPSVADADGLVAQLGFGPGGRRQRFDLTSKMRRILHPVLGLLAYQVTTLVAMPFILLTAFAGLGIGIAFMVGVMVLGLPFVYFFIRERAAAPRLEVGDDGLTIVTGKNKTRYLAKRDVFTSAQVAPGGGNIAMNTAEGPVVVSGIGLDRDVSLAAIRAIERRWAQPASPGARIAMFERSGRPIDTWRAELASKMGTTGYRGDVISVEEADAVVRNAGASPDARIGAALALAAAGERVRIADAAAPIADQRLRVALEAVADGREELELIEAATAPRAMRLR
jgi:hypothetical protein